MPSTPQKTTSVDVKFYECDSTTPLSNVSTTLTDNRKVFHIYSNHSVSNAKMFVQIDSAQSTSSSLRAIEIQPGKMTIGSSAESEICDATYNFLDGNKYSLKMYIVTLESTLYAKFSYGPDPQNLLSSYTFMYRADGGDLFNPNALVTNIADVQHNGTIQISCPMFVNNSDLRRPHTVRFMFDEKDNYPSPNTSDNSEALQCCAYSKDFNSGGTYTLTNVCLENDALYQINVIALYNDGHSVSHTLANMVVVLAKPVISSIIPYNINAGNDVPLFGTIMDVTLQANTGGVKLGAASNYTGQDANKNNTILFEFRQGSYTYFRARVAVNSTGAYTIVAGDVSDLLVQSPLPVRANNAYNFDVYAILEYTNPNDPTVTSANIVKTSDPYVTVFDDDLTPLPSQYFNTDNAWVSSAVTTVSGTRMVNIADYTSSVGYTVAPEFGIVGSFRKHAYYGSGVADGMFTDLDTIATKHKIQLTKYQADGVTAIPDSTVDVTQLVQMQASKLNMSAQELQQEYVNLLTSVAGINIVNNVRSVVSIVDMGINDGINGNAPRGIFADSSRGIVSVDPVIQGVTVCNTGAGTAGAASGVIPKVNIYYYSHPLSATNATTGAQNSSNSFTLNNATGLGMYAVFYQNAGAKQYPFFIAYTSKTASGNKSWYKSKVFFGPESYGGDTSDTSRVGLTLIYTGTDDNTLFPNLIPSQRRIKYELKLNNGSLTGSLTNANAEYASELMGSLSLQTSSVAASTNAGDFNFRLLETGMFTSHASFNQLSLTYESGGGESVINKVRTVLRSTEVGINDDNTGLNSYAHGLFADSSRGIVSLDANNRGVTILNTGAGTSGAASGVIPKVNIYYYSHPLSATNATTGAQDSSNSFTLNDATGLGVYAMFNQNAGAKQYPFFLCYTSKTASGNKSWYKSKVFFGPQSYAGDTSDASRVGLTLVYTGTDDGTFMPEIPSQRRIQYELKLNNGSLTGSLTNANIGYATELMGSLSLQTSSVAASTNAGDFNFRLLEMGMFTSHASFGQISVLLNNIINPSYLSSSDGLFPNIPGQAGVSGLSQPPILYYVPASSGLYSQKDIVKLSITIYSPAMTTSLYVPAYTNNSMTVAHKVNRYSMAIGTVSEPEFTGSGSTGVLTVPINNPTVVTGDFYFSSATFTSSLTDSNASVTKPVATDGVFVLDVLNPSPRGVSNPCTYSVYYTISIPSPNVSTIRGPVSEPYTIQIKDEPTNNNFVLTTPYSYKTFNADNQSSFTFDIQFQDFANTSIDGVNIYFNSNADYIDGSNAVTSKFHLIDVKRDRSVSSQTVLYTLQSTAPLTNAVTDGVKIMTSSGESAGKWRNYGAGIITIEPYVTKKVDSVNDSQVKITAQSITKHINNIPSITKVQNIVLNGGILELYNETNMVFDNARTKYAGVSTVTPSYVLTVNSQDQSGSITSNDSSSDKYAISLGANVSNYSLNIKVKLVAGNDNSVHYSEAATLVFNSVSVDVSTMTIDVRRNSNNNNLYIVRGNYTVSQASYLNETEVKLVNNNPKVNLNPTASGVSVLSWTGTGGVQPTGTNVSPNVYSLTGLSLSDALYLQYRVQAGVKYTLQYASENSPANRDSTPDYVKLKAYPSNNVFLYTIAVRPEVTLSSPIEIDPSNNMIIKMKINAKGLSEEGLQSALFVLAQEGDYTSSADVTVGEGAQVFISFNSSNVSESYIVAGNSNPNINPGEEATMSVTDVPGFNEASGLTGAWKLKVGSLDANDLSVLTFPAFNNGTYGGFIPTAPLSAVVAVATRVGIDIDMKGILPIPLI